MEHSSKIDLLRRNQLRKCLHSLFLVVSHFCRKQWAKNYFGNIIIQFRPNSTLSRRFLGRLEELHPIDQIMVAAHFLLLAIPAFAFGPGKSSGPLPLEKHVIRRSVSDGKVADLYEGLTKEKNGKANLQATTTAYMGNFVSGVTIDVSFDGTTWNGISPGNTVTSTTASDTGGISTFTVSQTGGSLLNSSLLSFGGFCSISATEFNLAHVLPADQSTTTNYDLSYYGASPRCSVSSGLTGRIFWINNAKVKGKMHHTDVFQEGQNSGSVLTNEFDQGTFSDGSPTAGVQYLTYITYARESGVEDCYVCRISVPFALTSATIYYTFYGLGPALVAQAYGGTFSSISCTVDSTVCVRPSSDSSSNVCLSSDTKISLSSGGSKNISEATVGENIMVGKASGGVDVAPIAFIPHKKNNQTSEFVNIMVAGGEKHKLALSVTPGHFVIVSKECKFGQIEMLRGDHVSPGMCLVNDHDQLVEVLSVSRSVKEGVYTIVADHPDGVIIANGFKVSSFGENHGVVNAYYHMHRFFSRYLPKWMLDSSVLKYLNSFMGDMAVSFA
ncbi:hypothetical protein AAMO2058_000826600 [Amorphochlora amoebiformis]